MKKIYLFLLLLLYPFTVFAYSDYIIPGGESIGIEIKSDGIMVVGFYKVDGKYNKGTPKIAIGDKIVKVDGVTVETVSDMVQEMEKNASNGSVTIELNRDGKKKECTLDLIKEGNTYKTGLYVKDEISGIGTLTYIDPETKIYGALGHNIVESNTNDLVEVRTGTIFASSITSIDRSVAGTPGGKNAKFYSAKVYGSIEQNIGEGIYGIYTAKIPNKESLKVAQVDEIKIGMAKLLTVLEGEETNSYDIEITKIDKNNGMKNIYFKVTDKTLLEKTGGIVQGMSGSPIIQDDKIVGAVTHVVISNPSVGYGISIVNMLEAGEKNT